ncbi:E3 ubiquitin-protein ligase RNF115-like isoform X2 [Tachypleus tridentatus]|uniref:E3 ubiquitin-protein ligase RNF115-like isoform X2 n=1 Tax=Tachypleus tridentatus TaxID=6853 RepID=UPI003FD681F3
MAEAVVVESPMQKFFCHKCTQEINLVLPDFTCPRCQSGFIEELSEGLHDNASDVPDEDLDMEYHIRELDGLLQAALLDALRRADYDHGRSSADNHHSNLRDSSQLDPGIFRRVGGGQHRNTGFYRQPSQENPSSRHSLEGIIHQVFASLFGDADVLGNGAIPMFFNLHGNPGDYAWGRESLDSIITELLNRIDGTGPPPLPKEKIAEIPTVQIAEELVAWNMPRLS